VAAQVVHVGGSVFAGLVITSEPSLLTLVLGGVRSGKSRYAEGLLVRHAPPWIYVATAHAFDEEMRVRIAAHRVRRNEGWRTVEAPVDLAGAIAGEPERPVLVDCLTLWLTNLVLGGHDIEAAIASLEVALGGRLAPTVLVSNEVGLGIVPETPLGRSFRDQAGVLNQRVAARADRVVFMIAGLPMTLK
jgi:adenosyl cobinamide kinase/adenosyl cobinamide phosphate guanylyltransferase